MSFFIKTLKTSDKLATKNPSKRGFIAVFFIFGLFAVFSNVFAYTPFEDNFDSYILDSVLNGQGGWTASENYPNDVLIKDDQFVSNPHSIGFSGLYSYATHSVSDLAKGVFSGKIYPIENWGKNFRIALKENVIVCQIQFDTYNDRIFNGYELGDIILDNLHLENKWTDWDFYFDADTDKISICVKNDVDNDCSDWVDCYNEDIQKTFDIINGIYLKSKSTPQIQHTYFDDLSFGELDCSLENCGACENWFDCQEVGCCWYYSSWLQENYCVDCDVGECDSSWFGCPNCLTQETCEAQESCYWFNGLCKFGTGECGWGLECQFCDTQETCEAKDCYWYSDFCWISAPLGVSSWADYYTAHGGYDTSLIFVDNMADLTETMFDSVSGFLTGFVDAFDTSEAMTQGANFGSAIPKARGYLSIFNNFFGELPVAQMFLFLITFLFAVGVFRLIRNLITLVKFW